MSDILRDRVVLPPGEINVTTAGAALRQFEQDVQQAKVMQQAGKCDTLIIDGGSLLLDVITIVTLDESKNKNNTFRYAARNAYIKNLFNELNQSNLNVVWTSKAKPLWIGDKKMPNEYVPDCHDDIPYMVDVNVQMKAEQKPGAGLNYYGVIGMNAFNDKPVGVSIPNLTYDTMMALLFPARAAPPESGACPAESGSTSIRGQFIASRQRPDAVQTAFRHGSDSTGRSGR